MNEFEKDRSTSEQLVELLDNEQDITICSDVVHGLYHEYKHLQEENEELKKQLEEINNFINKANFANIEQLMLDYCAKTEEQKEFIQYLEDYIEVLKSQQENVNGLDILEEETLFILEETLEKYKEIIGDKE